MTEHQIERHVERMTDQADRQYMAGELTKAEYDARMAKIDRWAETEYRAAAWNVGALQ